MGKQVERVSTRTVLNLGFVEAPVGLFKTTGDSSLPTWDKAAPDGSAVLREQRTREVAPELDPDAPPVPVLVPDVEAEVEEMRRTVAAHEEGAELMRRRIAELQPAAPVEETYQAIVHAETGEELEEADVRKGVRLEDGSFVDLTDELAKVDAQVAKDEMRVVSFIRVEQVPRARILGSYYLGSDGPGSPKVLRLLYEGMRRTHRVAVVKWTKTSRQALGVIAPLPRLNGALGVIELAWEEDWREPSPRCLTHLQAQVTTGELEAAEDFIRAMADSVASLEEVQDDRRVLYRQLKEAALAGDRPVVEDVPEAAPEGTDLETALRLSVEHADRFASVG